MEKLDHRRKYYLVLDCETATLPCASEYAPAQKKKIAIAKPLIYDLGWTIVDAKGTIYRRKSYLITEIFSVPSVFSTAYYAWKRPLYLEKLARGEITLTSWREAVVDLEKDLAEVEGVSAYNAMFDYKKAIPFTDLYINELYSPDFFQWEQYQKELCEKIATTTAGKSEKDFEPNVFRFHGKDYTLYDLWGLSCENLLNNDDFRATAHRNQWYTASGKYFSTTAETTFRYVRNQHDFDEAHTAIEDAEIESEILGEIFKRVKPKNATVGIIYFPFRIVGRAE